MAYVIPIGEWVLREACEQAAKWISSGFLLETISVNVSASQPRRGDFPQVVAAMRAGSGLPAHYIELELTESAFLHDIDNAIKLLSSLRKLGVKLSIDDSGTGYLNLMYLKMLRVDRLKIGRLFVQDLPTSTHSLAIVKTPIRLGRDLELAITAKGVKTLEQLEALRSLKCDEVQGFLLSRPIDPETFESTCRDLRAHTDGQIFLGTMIV